MVPRALRRGVGARMAPLMLVAALIAAAAAQQLGQVDRSTLDLGDVPGCGAQLALTGGVDACVVSSLLQPNEM